MGKYEKIIEKRVKKILYNLPAGKIALALSGGKDSIYLGYLLDKYNIKYDIIYFKLPVDEYSDIQLKYIKKFSKEFNKKLIICDLTKYNIVKISKERKRPVCSLCGLLKRYYFNKFARENGYDILLTGHNLTDIYRFLLVNLSSGCLEYSARNLPINPPPHKKYITLAKPLFFVPESYIREEITELNLEYCRIRCKYSNDKWYRIIKLIEETSIEIVYESVLHFVKKYSKILKKETNFCECMVCGEPTSSKTKICNFCRVFYFSDTNNSKQT